MRRCPICGGTDLTPLLQSGTGYPVLRCRACQTAFTDAKDAPAPSALYPAFNQSQTAAARRVRSAMSLFLRQRAAFVRSLCPSGRLLDFGCGNGEFARFMSEHGFEAVGLEPFSLGERLRAGRLELRREPWESAAPGLGTFDVITLWHVLEHLQRPVELLQQLAAHLSPGGVLVVSVPNFRSWQSALFHKGWFHLDAPRHLIHFEPETLAGCLERAGLHRVAERRFLPEYGSSGWIQSLLNLALPHPNFLYEVVKDRNALAGMGRASFAGHLAASVVLGAPVLGLSLPVEAAASLFNRSAALTVAARPRV